MKKENSSLMSNSNYSELGNQILIKKEAMCGEYTFENLIADVDTLMPHFNDTQPIIAKLCKGISLTEKLGNILIYGGLSNGRPYRMLMFVLLLNESANLKTDYSLAFRLLKEAYVMTDNIYGQLKNSSYPFILSDYMSEMEKALPNRNIEELHEEEVSVYNNLPDRIKIYRGMSDAEKESGKFGISWTQDPEYALNYVFYKKNEVKGTIGWRAEMEIEKKDVFAVWGIVGQRKEIVVNPMKCKNVKFEKYRK